MMIWQRLKSKANKARRGASLLELAIGLGIVGIVGGAIWATASSVRSRHPIDDTAQLVAEIASNVRNVYTGFPGAVPPAAVAGQIAGSLFPVSVINKAGDGTINAWGGSILIHFVTIGGSLKGFSIEFTLPASMDNVAKREACAGMATRLRGSASNFGAVNTLTPDPIPSIDATQGAGPALTLLNTGGWVNVTDAPVSSLFGAAGNNNCTGFAFVYRL